MIRYSVFLLVLFVALEMGFVGMGIYSKRTQANVSSASLRNSFLIGDNRSVVDILSNTLINGYSSIGVFKLDEKEFIVLGKRKESFFTAKYLVQILANPQDEASKVGSIVFGFTLLPFMENAFWAWSLFVFITSPYLFFEKNRLKKRLEDDLKMKEAIWAKNLAEKVSHDIRSPIAAANAIVSNLAYISEKDLSILKSALHRVESIANELLDENKTVANNQFAYQEIDLKKVIQEIIKEKKLEFSFRSEIEMRLELQNGISVLYCEERMKRILSNLVNNSYEAIEGSGFVDVRLYVKEKNAIVEVSDSGKGIPREILSKLGEKGFTYGKNGTKSGSGLGLYHAKNDLENAGGKLLISSREGEGAKISIEFPLVNDENDNYDFVFIDDDELLRTVWSGIAEKKELKLLVLSSVDEFESKKAKINFDTKIYIDSELGSNSVKGEDFALKLHLRGYKNLFISSGHPAEKFSQYPWLRYISKKCPL